MSEVTSTPTYIYMVLHSDKSISASLEHVKGKDHPIRGHEGPEGE